MNNFSCELEKSDPYECMINYMMDIRKIIKCKLEQLGVDATVSNGKDNQFGDCRHHSGINLYIDKKQYFIGFAGMNIDESKGNVHSSIGRLQLFIGDGNPNKKQKIDGTSWYDIKYPRKKAKNVKELLDKRDLLQNAKNNEIVVFNTGYRIMGNQKWGDILLNVDDENMLDEFCKLVIEFIRAYTEKEE